MSIWKIILLWAGATALAVIAGAIALSLAGQDVAEVVGSMIQACALLLGVKLKLGENSGRLKWWRRPSLRSLPPIATYVLALLFTAAAWYAVTGAGLLFRFLAQHEFVTPHLDTRTLDTAVLLIFAKKFLVHPFAEEIVYRGVLLSLLLMRFCTLPALLISTIWFCLVHPMSDWWAVAFGGIWFGCLFLATGRLPLAIVSHAIWNVLTLLGPGIGFAPFVLATEMRWQAGLPLWLISVALTIAWLLYLARSLPGRMLIPKDSSPPRSVESATAEDA